MREFGAQGCAQVVRDRARKLGEAGVALAQVVVHGRHAGKAQGLGHHPNACEDGQPADHGRAELEHPGQPIDGLPEDGAERYVAPAKDKQGNDDGYGRVGAPGRRVTRDVQPAVWRTPGASVPAGWEVAGVQQIRKEFEHRLPLACVLSWCSPTPLCHLCGDEQKQGAPGGEPPPGAVCNGRSCALEAIWRGATARPSWAAGLKRLGTGTWAYAAGTPSGGR